MVAYFNPHMGFKFRLSTTAKGLSWVLPGQKKKKKTASLIFEGDWEESILTIKNQSFHHPFVGYLIKEIMSSINSLQFFSFSHTRQQGNSLAHALAQRARSSFPVLVWRKSIPSDIYKFYVSDVVEKK